MERPAPVFGARPVTRNNNAPRASAPILPAARDLLLLLLLSFVTMSRRADDEGARSRPAIENPSRRRQSPRAQTSFISFGTYVVDLAQLFASSSSSSFFFSFLLRSAALLPSCSSSCSSSSSSQLIPARPDPTSTSRAHTQELIRRAREWMRPVQPDELTVALYRQPSKLSGGWPVESSRHRRPRI